MFINVLVIVLKVFWIEVALFWRDIVTPYKTRNGEYLFSRFSSQGKVPLTLDYFFNDILLLNPISVSF